MKPIRLRIPKNLVIIFILTGLAIGFATYYSYENVILTSRSGTLVSDAREAMFRIDGISSKTSENEEYLKEAALTGNKNDVALFDTNKADLIGRIAELKAYEAGNPVMEHNVSRLLSEINIETSNRDTAMMLRDVSPEMAQMYVETGPEKATRYEIKNIINEMKEGESSLLMERQEANAKALYKSVRAILLSAGLGLILIMWLLYLLYKDILKRKKAENLARENESELLKNKSDLAESNKKFLTIFSSSMQAVCVAEIYSSGRLGKVTEVNNSFCELFQLKKNEVTGHSISELELITKDELEKLAMEVAGNKYLINYELNMFRRNGEQITCLLSYNEVELNGKMYRISVFSNITERKKLETELIAAKNKAEESTSAKEFFVANMSHEIRTPLTGIIGLGELLYDTELNGEQREYLEGIKTSSESLLTIINEVLDLSKINAGKVNFRKTPFTLLSIIKNVAFTIEPRANRKNVKFSYEIDHDVPEKIIGDSVRLSQILWNIAGNAIKFTESGSVTLKISAKNQDNNSAEIQFQIIDTGIGIAEDRRKGIFEAFTQADESTSRKFGGTGLGLTISSKLVELQGGRISVESEEGKGSTFSFTIKYTKYFEQIKSGTEEQATANIIHSFDLENIRVLLAEDNKINQKVCSKMLSSRGAIVDIADNGKIAVEKLSSSHYDIILMDIQMPEMNGYESTKYIRSMMPKPKSLTPILALTAFAMEGENERCFIAGMNGYVSKPFKASELCDKVINLTKGINPVPILKVIDNQKRA